MLDQEIFCDGSFLCLTDWAHLGNISYSPEAFSQASIRVALIQQECSWLGFERVFLPDLLEVPQAPAPPSALKAWLVSLRGALAVFAVANVTELQNGSARLTFWGTRKCQVILKEPGRWSGPISETSYELYTWIYREVPHASAALRIARTLVTQQLGPDPESNLETLQARLADIIASAKANYAAFVQEKLKDFFTLGKEISIYTTAAAEYLYKTLSDLNESLRKSVFTVLGVIGGALLSTSAVQLNPLTYTTVLAGYAAFLLSFNVWYLPSNASLDFDDHLRHFRSRVEPYREFLSANQQREVFEDIPAQYAKRFAKTRRLVRLVNGVLAGFLLCLSGFDIPHLAKYFTFSPTWALGRSITWLLRWIVR
jgi:hypothetical protein